MMKINKLIILIAPLILTGCSQGEEAKQYQSINDQQTIMKEYYRQHTSNQSYLSTYSYKHTLEYDPTYDVFGELAPVPTSRGQYFEATISNEVGVYSGYLVVNDVESIYLGNKANVGSIDKDEKQYAFYFRNFDEEGHDGELELISRTVTIDNDLDPVVIDEKSGTAVESDNVSHYFSNNINTDYKNYFKQPLEQPTASTEKQVSAYSVSSTEIIETYKESISLDPIENPIHPGEEHKMTVMKQTVGKTTFKLLDKIGWAGTEFTETITYSLISDYELKLLDTPRTIKKEEKTVSFNYSVSLQPYTGEPFIYQEKDEKLEKYKPNLFYFNGSDYIPLNPEIEEVSSKYKKLHPEFSGYVYHIGEAEIEEGKSYSIASNEDISGETPNYETIGYNQLSDNALGTIVSSGIEGHNLFRTLTETLKYEFIVLYSATGSISLIAHLAK